MKLKNHLEYLSKEINSEFEFIDFEYTINSDVVFFDFKFKKRFKIDVDTIENIKKVFNILKKYGFSHTYNYELIFRDLKKSYYFRFERIEGMLGKSITSINIEYDFSTNKDWINEYKEKIKAVDYQLKNNPDYINNFYNYDNYYFLIKDDRSGKLLNGADIERGKPYFIYLGKEISGEIKILSIIRFFIPKNYNSFVVDKVYTLPGFRRKGYSSILHKFIQDKTGMKYDSDLEFTKSGFLHMLSNREKILSEKLNKKMKYIKLFENFEIRF